MPLVTNANIVKEIKQRKVTMKTRFIVLAALVLAFGLPTNARSSEDEDPFMFGDEIPVEDPEADSAAPAPVNPITWHEEQAPALQSTPQFEADFTPPPSDSAEPQPLPATPSPQTLAQPQAPTPTSPAVEDPAPAPSAVTAGKEPTLTDTLKQDPDTQKPILPAKVEESWVGKLTTGNPLSLIGGDKSSAGGASLEQLVDSARDSKANSNRRSNASVFDISGVMLRMSLKQVDETMQNRGFRKIMQKYQIPNFIKWRNEEYCRNTGVVGYERIESCVTQKAKKDQHQYVQTAKYAKYDTKEEVEVTFSSNFTDNKVIKIVYHSQAANVSGNSPKANYLRNIKIYDFWKKINQKFGKPDDKENVIWGMGGNKPFLKAATGYLQLEDPMLRELDYTRMSREDQRYLNTDLYSF